MPRARKRPSRRNLLISLVVVSVIGLLLPDRFTGRLISLVQPLVPLQDWSTRGVQAVGDAYGRITATPVDSAAHAVVQRENDRLQHQLASLAGRLSEVERERDSLARIRHRGLARGQLIPARAVAEDAVPWRDTRLVNVGTLSGVRPGAPVASHHFTIRTGESGEATNGLSVLAGETLVGFVEQAGTHSARVRLISDSRTALTVIVARHENDQYHPLDKRFMLVGTGERLLKIRDVDHRYIDSGAIQMGDFVLCSGDDTRLPAPMTIGTIVNIRVDTDNALLYELAVEQPVTPADLRKVYLLNPEPSASQ